MTDVELLRGFARDVRYLSMHGGRPVSLHRTGDFFGEVADALTRVLDEGSLLSSVSPDPRFHRRVDPRPFGPTPDEEARGLEPEGLDATTPFPSADISLDRIVQQLDRLVEVGLAVAKAKNQQLRSSAYAGTRYDDEKHAHGEVARHIRRAEEESGLTGPETDDVVLGRGER